MLSPTLAYAKEQKEHFVVANSPSGENTFIGNIYKNRDFKSLELKVSNINNNSFNTLESYYTFGKENKLNKIKEIFYSNDGSLTWINNELKAMPDKFSGFKKLYKVDATNHFYWGGYDIYLVDWFVNNNKKVMTWYDAIYCENNNKCFVSNLMIDGSENSGIYAQAIKLVSKRPISNAEKLPYTISLMPENKEAGRQNPLNLSFKVDWLKQPYEISLKKIQEKSNKEGGEKRLAKLSDFLVAIWSLDINASSNEERKSGLTKAISENWSDFNPRKMFSVFNKNSENQKIEKSAYIPSAYIEKLTNMDSYSVLGYLYAENETYIVGNASFDNNRQIMVFSVNNADYKLKQRPQNKMLHAIIYSTIFHKKLNRINEGI